MNIQKYTVSNLVPLSQSPEGLGRMILSFRFRQTKFINASNVPSYQIAILNRRSVAGQPDYSSPKSESFEREQINFTERIELVREGGKVPMVANFDWGTSDKTNVIAYRVTRWMTEAEMRQDRLRA